MPNETNAGSSNMSNPSYSFSPRQNHFYSYAEIHENQMPGNTAVAVWLDVMTIHPHKSVGDLAFGATRAALHKAGTPVRERLNRIGELELDYGQIVYRFEQDRFVEATFPLPVVLELDEQRIEGGSLLAFLRQHDPCFREVHGFAVAPSFGLAVDLDEDDPNRWTTAFAAGRWDKIK